MKAHAICTCCLERTHRPGEEPTIALFSRATFGDLHVCSACETLCTLPGCRGVVPPLDGAEDSRLPLP